MSHELYHISWSTAIFPVELDYLVNSAGACSFSFKNHFVLILVYWVPLHNPQFLGSAQSNFTWFKLRKHWRICNYLISCIWCIRQVNHQVLLILWGISVKNWDKVQPFPSSQTFYSFKCLCSIKCGGILAPKCIAQKIDVFLVSNFPSLCSLLMIHMPSNAWSTGINKYLAVTVSLSESQLVWFSFLKEHTQRI